VSRIEARYFYGYETKETDSKQHLNFAGTLKFPLKKHCIETVRSGPLWMSAVPPSSPNQFPLQKKSSCEE